MKAKHLIFKGIVSGLILLLVNSADQDSTQAQSINTRQKENNKTVSSNYRTVKLTAFGIEVDIPGNYRAIRPQKGIVQMFDPELSYYVETIQLFDGDRSMSLREQAKQSVGYSVDEQGNRVPNAKEIVDYKQGNLSGYIVKYDSGMGYGVVFVGTLLESNQLLKIGTGCDCDVEITAITDLLSRIRLIPAR